MPFWSKAYDGIVERETKNTVIVLAYRVERNEITLNFRLLIGTIITKKQNYTYWNSADVAKQNMEEWNSSKKHYSVLKYDPEKLKYRYYANDFCRQVLGYESNL